MKIMSFIFSFIIFFMYVEIDADAQSREIEIIKKENSGTSLKDTSMLHKMIERWVTNISNSSGTTEKDTAREREMIIIKKRLEERNKDLLERQKELLDRQLKQLDRQKELKDLQYLDHFNVPPVPPVPGQQDLKVLRIGGGLMSGSNDLSELRLTKSFKGESVETTKKFSVTTDNTALNFNLSGKVKSGVITVTLVKPNGKKYKTIEIDPTSDVSFSQGIDLKKEPKEWTGDWQIKIQAEKADGDYRLNILTR